MGTARRTRGAWLREWDLQGAYGCPRCGTGVAPLLRWHGRVAAGPPLALGALFVVEGAAAELLSDLPEWALRDPVTGLGNRHLWEREAPGWASRSGCRGWSIRPEWSSGIIRMGPPAFAYPDRTQEARPGTRMSVASKEGHARADSTTHSD